MARRERAERGASQLVSDRGGNHVKQSSPPKQEGLGVGLVHDFMGWILDRFEKLGRGGSEIGTGLPEVDMLLNGINPGCIYLLLGRSEVGKTSFALNIVANRIMYGKNKIMLFAMASKQELLVERIVSALSGLDTKTLRSSMMDDLVWGKCMEALDCIKYSDVEFFCDPELQFESFRIRVCDYAERARGQGDRI